VLVPLASWCHSPEGGGSADGSTLERGPEDVKRFTEEYRSAFPDWRISIDEQIAEGDKVVNRVTLRGTHLRQLRDMAPTGKEVGDILSRELYTFVGESWEQDDDITLLTLERSAARS
jgi:hypothetical protein